MSVGGKWRSTNYLLAKQAFYAAEAGAQDGASRLINGAIVDMTPASATWNSGTNYASATADFTNSFTVQHWVAGGAVKTDGFGMPYYVISSTGYDGATKKAQKTIEATIALRRSAPFSAGVVGCNAITVNGRSIVDSYNSSAGSYASQVPAGSNHARSNDYAQTCLASANIDLSGGAAIYGSASATGVVSMSNNSTVSGTVKQHQPTSPCDPLGVAALVESNRPTGTPSSISLQSNNTQTISAPGNYYYSSISLKANSALNITANGVVNVFIDGDFNLEGQAVTSIVSTARVSIYITGNMNAAGGGIVNQGVPPNLLIYSSATGNNQMSIAGSNDFRGAVYAPLTDVKLSGGADFFGAVRGKTVNDVGNTDFHYDEALKNMPGGSILGYTLVSWKEVFN